MTREEITERLEYLGKVISNGYDTASMQARMSHPNAKFLAERTMDYVRAFEREREELRKELMAMDNVDKVQPKDMDKDCIYVKYEPMSSRRLSVVDGKIDLSLLEDTKYGKYIIGLSYDDKWDSYTIALSEEGQALWKEEEESISRWMAKWGCD